MPVFIESNFKGKVRGFNAWIVNLGSVLLSAHNNKFYYNSGMSFCALNVRPPLGKFVISAKVFQSFILKPLGAFH